MSFFWGVLNSTTFTEKKWCCETHTVFLVKLFGATTSGKGWFVSSTEGVREMRFNLTKNGGRYGTTFGSIHMCSSCSSSWGQYISEPVIESAYNAVTGRTAKFFGRIFRWWDDGMVWGLDEKQNWKKNTWFWWDAVIILNILEKKKNGNKFKLAATRIWSCSQWASRSILFLWGRSFRNKKWPPPPPREEKPRRAGGRKAPEDDQRLAVRNSIGRLGPYIEAHDSSRQSLPSSSSG